MTFSIVERRRSPRAFVTGDSWLTLSSAWPVQLLDLSLSGLSFASPYEFEVGRTVSVRTTLAGQAFIGQIRVCWSRSRPSGAGRRSPYEVGGVFLPLEDESRKVLEAFLKKSPAL